MRRENAVKLPHRRQFLQLAAGAAALPVASRIAWSVLAHGRAFETNKLLAAA